MKSPEDGSSTTVIVLYSVICIIKRKQSNKFDLVIWRIFTLVLITLLLVARFSLNIWIVNTHGLQMLMDWLQRKATPYQGWLSYFSFFFPSDFDIEYCKSWGYRQVHITKNAYSSPPYPYSLDETQSIMGSQLGFVFTFLSGSWGQTHLGRCGSGVGCDVVI